MSGLNYAEVRDWAAELTREAGTRAAQMAGGTLNVQSKPDGSLVTDIDRAIEHFLRDAINAKYPDHAVLGEEMGHTGDPHAPLWALDPIDGTTNLANGLPLWGVSVGLVDGDEAVVGCVSFPRIGEFYAGAKGYGVTLNDEPLSPLGPGGPLDWEDAYGSCATGARDFAWRGVPLKLRVLGSAALEVCWTAAGRLKGCQSTGVSLYDVAAGLCIGGEVGMQARWLSGRANGLYSPREHAQIGGKGTLLTAPAKTLDYIATRLQKHR